MKHFIKDFNIHFLPGFKTYSTSPELFPSLLLSLSGTEPTSASSFFFPRLAGLRFSDGTEQGKALVAFRASLLAICMIPLLTVPAAQRLGKYEGERGNTQS